MLSNDSVNALLTNIPLSFAQFERNMIVPRAQEGKVIARQNPGYREEWPRKYKRAQTDHAMELLKTHSYRQTVELTGISRATLAHEAARRKKESEG